jgi:hypothetical protein
MSKFAARTAVTPDRSRAEIEQLLKRYGATHFMCGTGPDCSVLAFQAHGKHVRFVLPMPKHEDHSNDVRGYSRTKRQIDDAVAQAERSAWRALVLVIKAKLEAVETGITTFESEFLAHIVLPSKQTVGEWMMPQVEAAYQSGAMPPLLGWAGGTVNA